MLDPQNRMTATEALEHPWLSGKVNIVVSRLVDLINPSHRKPTKDNSLPKVKEQMKQTVDERKESRLSQLN